MRTVWVVVAESSRAKVYATDALDKELVEIECFDHAGSRLHARDITSDLPGRNIGSDGSHHAMTAETDIKEEEAVEFSRQINKYLQAAVSKQQVAKLMIIAAPAFLGHLRAHMDAQVAKLVVFELAKNLVQCDAEEIRAHLPAHP
jgi:protein required for attachment to host cells